MVESAFPYVAMKGTHQSQPLRCVCLQGEIGSFGTTCSIYEQRSSTCRGFWASLEQDGETRSDYCDKARAAHGMAPLELGDWGAYWRETGQGPDMGPDD